MDAILSIKPVYANRILEGTKKVEFRKKGFREKVHRVYIYASVPAKQIVGYFTFSAIEIDTPANLWNKYKDVGGISEEDFFQYYANNQLGCALLIKSVTVFKQGKNPNEFINDFVPPQSYVYIETTK
ncbi:MAG: ASCH domain-containing protein [Paludibacteraceae bacterium]